MAFGFAFQNVNKIPVECPCGYNNNHPEKKCICLLGMAQKYLSNFLTSQSSSLTCFCITKHV